MHPGLVFSFRHDENWVCRATRKGETEVGEGRAFVYSIPIVTAAIAGGDGHPFFSQAPQLILSTIEWARQHRY